MEMVKELNNLLVSLFNTVLKMEEKALKEGSNHNLSLTELHTLAAIGTGRAKTMTQVANSLKISVGTLTVAINKLVKKEYVNRFRVPEDRRIVKIELTQEGIEAVLEHEAFHLNMVGEAVAGLSQEQTEVLVESLGNINNFFKLQQVKPIVDSEEIKMKALNIGGLTIPVPIFQGGMGIGVSMSNLATAVAKCGGVGVISAAQPGFMEEDFYRNPIAANVRALQRNIKEAVHAIKDLPNRGAIGVNIMCVGKNYDELVKASIEAGAHFIISGAGLPTSLPGICKGSKVKLIPIVSSARATAIIIKNWAKKFDRVPDAVIFEGPEAGGHLGFKEEQLEGAQENFYKTITEIKRELETLPNCPLIVAGGIYEKADMEKAMAYGADGVQMGTRFVTTEECDVSDAFKQAYLNCKKQDITILRSPVGMPGRAIKNAFIKKVEQGRIPPERCNGCISSCNPKEAMYCITEALISAAKGDVDNGLVFCGSKAYKAKKIETVPQIFAEFCGE